MKIYKIINNINSGYVEYSKSQTNNISCDVNIHIERPNIYIDFSKIQTRNLNKDDMLMFKCVYELGNGERIWSSVLKYVSVNNCRLNVHTTNDLKIIKLMVEIERIEKPLFPDDIEEDIEEDNKIVNNDNNYENLSDIDFRCKDGVIVKGYKILLSKISPVFYSMFSGNFKDENIINVDDIDSETMKKFIDYSISNKYKAVYTTDYELIRICNRYIVTSFMNKWNLKCIDDINIKNVIYILKISKEMDNSIMYKYCISFIKTNINNIEYLNELDKDDLINILKNKV